MSCYNSYSLLASKPFTVDKNLPFQQNIAASGVAVIIVTAPTNRLNELRPLAPAIPEALTKVRKGEVVRVGA